MPIAASRPAAEHELVDLSREATAALDALLADAVAKVRERVVVEGHAVGRLFDREQRATHGLAWLATYVEAVRQLAAYAERMTGDGSFGEIEEHLVRIGLGEYLAQIVGGIPMSQGEMVRPADLGLSHRRRSPRASIRCVEGLIASGNTAERRARLVELMREQPRRHGRHLRPRRDAGIDPRGDAQVRRQRSDRQRAELAPHQQLHPARSHRADVRARRVRPDHPGRIRRHGARQGVDVRRLRGTVARLYRRRLARHALRDRRRTDPRQRHRASRRQNGCRRSPPARCCRPRCSPSRTPAPISPRSRRAPCAKATSTRSTATRPGSRIRCAPT